jgi:branched-chain amino acid transport system ATP-binding protein
MFALLGQNGAGKTTTIKMLCGLLAPTSGDAVLKGNSIVENPAAVKQIINVSPQETAVAPKLSVKENLELGAYLRKDTKKIAADLENIFDIFPRLKERENQSAGTLSGGEQQMLAMGRGLMSSPELIMLDEPSLGLAPLLVNTIFEIITNIKAMGKTILLVEQNAYKALKIADRAYVLEQGVLTMDGSAQDIANNPKVREAYLGSQKSSK